MEDLEAVKAMIQRELSGIRDLEERRAFRDMMEGVFLSLWETNADMYQKLQERVIGEIAWDMNRFCVCTGLVEKENLDPVHPWLAPVWEEDTKKTSYQAKELRQIIREKGKARLATVFVQCGLGEVKSLLGHAESCSGRLKAGEEYPVPVFLEPAQRYLDQMEHLYHLFMKNGIPWRTVNAPCFFKMVDVCIRQIPDTIPDQQEITDFGMDFGAFNGQVRFGMIPVWNVRRLELESMGFPVPCRDHESYEHTISVAAYGEQNAYLVEEKAGIQNVSQRGNRLYITGSAANEKRWNVYMICREQDSRVDRFPVPLFQNRRTDRFSERYSRQMGQPVRTRAELERFIRGLGLEDYIQYQDCALTGERGERQDTYPVNVFLRDEIRGKGGRQKLTLYFKPVGKERWLLLDLASYIAAEVQELYPEYECGGRLV